MADPPARFPCWCRATYSWGGETKKDLGFIEGDLIEALNAGDGLWWTGRLRRDPRAIGSFPSNFVTVLEDSFQPVSKSRNSSPLAQSPIGSVTPTKAKSVFRKPFQAYEELGKRGSVVNAKSRQGTPESDSEKIRKEKTKYRPYSSMKTAQAPTSTLKKQAANPEQVPQISHPRIPDPPPRGAARSRRKESNSMQSGSGISSRSPLRESHNAVQPQFSDTRPSYNTERSQGHIQSHDSRMQQSRAPPISRPHSPLPSTYHDGSAYPQLLPASRQPSPAPSYNQSYSQDPVSEFSDLHEPDSPPPPPPTHRILYQNSRAPSPQPFNHAEYSPNHSQHDISHGHSPSPSSNMTPSPLREAMNDVMNSLQDMSAMQNSTSSYRQSSAQDIWSPDDLDIHGMQIRNEQGPSSEYGYHEQSEEELGYNQPSSYMQESAGQRGLVMYHQERSRSLYGLPSLENIVPAHKNHTQSNSRPLTSGSGSSTDSAEHNRRLQRQLSTLRHQKSAHQLGREVLNRTYTTKTNATQSTSSSSATKSSASTTLTSRSIMSGHSAGGFSATSAGSLARRKFDTGSFREQRGLSMPEITPRFNAKTDRPNWVPSESSGSGPSYHESHSSLQRPPPDHQASRGIEPDNAAGILGGLSSPKSKRSGFFKKMIETAKTTARTSAANARSTIGSAGNSRPSSRSGSPNKNFFGSNMAFSASVTSLSRPVSSLGIGSRDVGPSSGSDWMQVRRDVNRSNSLSQRERAEREERCELHDIPVSYPIEELNELLEGDEGLDGLPVSEPTIFNTPNLSLVDKSARFVQNIPQHVNAITLAQSYVCRPHRSDVQRLRAIFTWVSERITWEDDFEGQLDIRRLLQERRGCSEEITLLVRDMCNSVGLHAEVIPGYLKTPGETPDANSYTRPNHFWNAVIVDGEWRMMDCALAGPTHPRRGFYTSAGSQVAEGWYFLTRPTEFLYTHIPLSPECQHVVPSINPHILAALPCACPGYFKNGLQLADFSTSMLYLNGLEMAHFHIRVPEDIECVAEVEARAFAHDDDGDVFESGEIIRKPALAQAEWLGGSGKRFTIKAVLPGDEGAGILRVFAGKRGLMHSIRDNPHAIALSLPLTHTAENPPYHFLTRHPTSHAQRHDLYVAQPQCARLTLNNTFVFCVRQHPSSLRETTTPDPLPSSSRPLSPRPPYPRPTSAMSMVSATASQVDSTSQYSDTSSQAHAAGGAQALKPAKLAIQSPSQKIVRLTRKQEHTSSARALDDEGGLTSAWETVIKIGERGLWRGLVLADRSARWCVFAEWECV